MKRKELLSVCEELIKSFDPALTTVDVHATEKLQDLSLNDQQFLQQILYGSYRYREVLRPMLAIFLDTHASQVSRADYTKYLIMGYLAMFRLEELGAVAFAQLALAHQPASMHTFLSFLFDPEALRGTLRAQWTCILDVDFVENQIVAKMLEFKPAIDKLLSQLYTKAFSGAASTGSSSSVPSRKQLTVPVAPNITRPKPRQAFEPIRIPNEVKANPVPAYLNRLSMAELQAQQEARKGRIQAEVASKYDSSDEFQLATATRGSNLDALRDQVERERQAALQVEFKAKPVPRTSRTIEVKLTTAAILREDALYQRKKDREVALMRAYESGLRDSFDFYRWQATMQQQDEAKWQQEVETRRLEMVQAQHDAMEAARQAKVENREVALGMKLDAEKRAAERDKDELALVEKYQQLTDTIKRVRDTAPREAEAHVREEKARQRDALQEFLAAERERKAQADAKERAAREDLIRQIRALDRGRREHVAVFDPTETAQLGLLQEMSLAELRERLCVRRDEQKRWEEARREGIRLDKHEKEALVLEKATNAARRRRATASATATARSKKKAEAAARAMEAQALRQKNNLALAEKLKRQREERALQTENLRVESEELATRRHFLGAAKTVLEERHFDQLKCGFERQARKRQETHQVTSVTIENVRNREQWMRREFRDRVRVAKEDQDKAKTEEYSRAKEEARRRKQQEEETLRALVSQEQQRVAQARATLQARNAYATRQTQLMTAQTRLWSATKSKVQPKLLEANSSTNQEQEQPQEAT